MPEGSPERTREHVFPQWLLDMAGLRNSSLTSLTRTLVPYRRLTIPCCRTCNGVDFAAIERRVKGAFNMGVESVRRLDRKDLFLWLGKIYYGILYAESLRPMDPKQQDGDRIVLSDHLAEHSFHHFLLQAASGSVEWQPDEPGPASFLIYECQTGPEPGMNFDYGDDLHLPILAIRIGEVGIIGVLQDCGAMESTQERRLVAARDLQLHPTQFREIFAMVRYLARETWKNRTHVIIPNSDETRSTVLLIPTATQDRGTVDTEVYAASLAEALHTNIEAVFNGTHVVCLTVAEDGQPTYFPWPEMLIVGIDGQPLWPAAVHS